MQIFQDTTKTCYEVTILEHRLLAVGERVAGRVRAGRANVDGVRESSLQLSPRSSEWGGQHKLAGRCSASNSRSTTMHHRPRFWWSSTRPLWALGRAGECLHWQPQAAAAPCDSRQRAAHATMYAGHTTGAKCCIGLPDGTNRWGSSPYACNGQEKMR